MSRGVEHRRLKELRGLGWSSQDRSQVIQGLSPLLLQALKDTGQDGMGAGTPLPLIAASRFADNDGRSEGPLGAVVGRLHPLRLEEPQEMTPLLSEPLGKPGIVRIGESALFSNQSVQPRLKRLPPGLEGFPIQLRLLLSQGQGLPQEGSQRSRKAHRPRLFSSSSLESSQRKWAKHFCLSHA